MSGELLTARAWFGQICANFLSNTQTQHCWPGQLSNKEGSSEMILHCHEKINLIQVMFSQTAGTGQVFSKRIEITPQIFIQKFEEHMALGWVLL